ncbi:MAG: hypothetical protein NT020_00940 [Chloroflexales bacterium]|nr:hypothetical protein [Chloroflexales bacterium]
MGYAVFVGDVALDEYYRADYWPTIQDKAIVHALPAVPGGMIANAACVAAALGLEVKFWPCSTAGRLPNCCWLTCKKVASIPRWCSLTTPYPTPNV